MPQLTCVHCGASFNRFDRDFVYAFGRSGEVGRQPRFDDEPCCLTFELLDKDEYTISELIEIMELVK